MIKQSLKENTVAPYHNFQYWRYDLIKIMSLLFLDNFALKLYLINALKKCKEWENNQDIGQIFFC